MPDHSDIEVLRTAGALYAAWEEALQDLGHRNSLDNYTFEQDAFDAVVNYVEEHGMNGSEFDPREIEDEDYIIVSTHTHKEQTS